MLTEPDEELVTWVRKRISDKHDLSPSADQVAKVIVATAVPSQPTYDSNQVSTDLITDKSGMKAKKQRKILGATVLGAYKELDSGKAMWLYVVEQVYARHPQNFLEKAAQLRGTKREFVSGSYQNKKRPEKVGDTGVFVETDLTIDKMESLARQLLKLFGYAASDLQIHEE